jgi:hypothetical protein
VESLKKILELSNKKRQSLIATILFLCAITYIISSETVEAQTEYPEGRYYLDSSSNVFPVETSIGTRFNVTFWAFNLSACWAYQFKVYCDPAKLNITRAWTGEWNSSWIFYGHTVAGVQPSIDKDINGYYALIGETLQSPEIAFNASGIMGIVEFNITAVPSNGALSCILNITNSYSYWLGPTPTTKHWPQRENGYYEIVPEIPPNIIVVLLMITTLGSLAVAKIARQKKRERLVSCKATLI